MMMSDTPHRRQIWNVKLDKERPAVVVSREAIISGTKEIIVVPLSASIKLSAPAGVLCAAGVGGLLQDSTALCPLVKALPKVVFKAYVGELPHAEFASVLKGVQHAIHADEALL
jgi:mRNA-degrading endonuclease toxin of MazEF toxin-antitoxin module